MYHGSMNELDRLHQYFDSVIPEEHLPFCIRLQEYTDKYVRNTFSLLRPDEFNEGNHWLALDPELTPEHSHSLRWLIGQWTLHPERFNARNALGGAYQQSKCLSSTLLPLRALQWVTQDHNLRQDLMRLSDTILVDDDPTHYWSAQNIAQIATQDTIDVLLGNPTRAAPVVGFDKGMFIGYALFHTRRSLIQHWTAYDLKIVCETLRLTWPDFALNSSYISSPVRALPLNVFALAQYFELTLNVFTLAQYLNKSHTLDGYTDQLKDRLKIRYLERFEVANDKELIFTYCQIKHLFAMSGWDFDFPKPRIIAATETMVETFHDHWLDRANQYMTLRAYQ